MKTSSKDCYSLVEWTDVLGERVYATHTSLGNIREIRGKILTLLNNCGLQFEEVNSDPTELREIMLGFIDKSFITQKYYVLECWKCISELKDQDNILLEVRKWA